MIATSRYLLCFLFGTTLSIHNGFQNLYIHFYCQVYACDPLTCGSIKYFGTLLTDLRA